MATASVALPKPRRRPRNHAAAGRASYPEIYFVKRIDNSRLRREVDLEKRRECFGLLGLSILVFLFGFLFAWQHLTCVRYGYQIEQLKAERAGLDDWNHQLRLEQASLADPERIDRLARKELGLASPAPRQMIPLGDNPGSAPETDAPKFARNFSAVGGDTLTPHQP